MDDSYNFNSQDFPKITLQLLIELFAYQSAATQIIIEKLNLSKEDKDDIFKFINAEMPKKKETILKTLYESFGKTPDI
jgi:hypothetical protein